MLNDEQLAELQHKGHVLVGRRIYHMHNGILNSFKKVKFNDLEQFIPAKPSNVHWFHSREVVGLAFSFVEQEQRELTISNEFNKNLLIIGDLELTELVLQGSVTPP
ncbi:hypothetical protein JF50_08590 [Pseudoalteromonas luteoviolacea]|uniref:Uncharacterized protein n=1 Tax=Pseudoalteromonas luteoviolacea TaxID=43657 RepID=A0A0C1QCW8_9GAMM|nr:hypothetical protein [Pseudoalteromonas luteoviolacea]KID57275.1 hypothetical protein JF50_08590 [Pseudoalteromonas luteoviolacea]